MQTSKYDVNSISLTIIFSIYVEFQGSSKTQPDWAKMCCCKFQPLFKEEFQLITSPFRDFLAHVF